MKILKYFGIWVLIMLSACGSKPKGDSAQTEYDKTLSDSIAAIQQEIDSCDSQAAVLRDQVGEWLHDFSTVANPREAGSGSSNLSAHCRSARSTRLRSTPPRSRRHQTLCHVTRPSITIPHHSPRCSLPVRRQTPSVG